MGWVTLWAIFSETHLVTLPISDSVKVTLTFRCRTNDVFLAIFRRRHGNLDRLHGEEQKTRTFDLRELEEGQDQLRRVLDELELEAPQNAETGFAVQLQFSMRQYYDFENIFSEKIG
jgi:hypothetical protein